jgi:outer membrane protein assembly factor BamA
MRSQTRILSKQRGSWLVLLVLAAAPALVTPCAAQETRAQELERQRDEKAARLHYDQPQKLEKNLFFIEDNKILERLTAGYHGLNVRLGGLVQGSGFALGPEYHMHRDSWGSDFFLGAQLSTKLYQRYYSRWNQPQLANDHFSLDLNAVHRNYSQVDYFGPGPRSLESDRTDYRLEDTAIDGALGVKPFKNLQLGGSAGYLAVNVGPGQSEDFPSTELVFSPIVIPGIDHQTDFLRYGPYVELDYLDKPDEPTGGGLYTFEFTWYRDQKLNLHDFQRMDIEAQQYISFFNKMRVIALRAKATLTDANRGQSIPFYMQPIVGGSEDLRGFLPFRFYDNNSFVLNAEYRWHVISVLDMALFADGGKVFPRRGELNFSHLQGDGGIGFRFNYQGRPFIRIDIAGSHEGFRFWFKFNDIFVRHPVGTASAQPIE